MFDFDWDGYHTAVAIVAAIILGISIPLMAGYGASEWTANNRDAEHYADKDAAATQKYQGEVCARLEGAASVECLQKAENAARENQRAEYDLNAQRNMALWAFWVVAVSCFAAVVTAVGVFLVWRTLVETQEMAKITREVGEAQVRAYLTCLGGEYWIDLDGFHAEVKFKNFGNSPSSLGIAEPQIDYSQCSFFRREDLADPGARYSGPTIAGVQSIAPGEEATMHVSFFRSDIDGRFWGCIGADDSEIWIVGCLEWYDVFRGARLTHFKLVAREPSRTGESGKLVALKQEDRPGSETDYF